jgi:FkbM family methyltransferase
VAVKRLIGAGLHRVGYDIRRRGSLGRTMADALAHLRARGFEPRTVIDVGIGNGTPDLYATFPKARYLLIEPVPEYEPVLRRLATTLDAVTVMAAAGREAGMTTLSVEGEGSTTYGVGVTQARQVPVVTIDALREEHHLSGPFLLKADVQGGELEVLAGARHTLQEAEAVILEVSFFSPRPGWPQFSDVFQWMMSEGFAIYDVFGGSRRRDGALAWVDVIFVKEAGRFRLSHVYP